MKRVLVIISLLLSFANAEINECVSDVYFANGIATNEKSAYKASSVLDYEFQSASPDSYKFVAEWKVALNHTQRMGIDLYESMLQKIDIDYCFDCIVATNE